MFNKKKKKEEKLFKTYLVSVLSQILVLLFSSNHSQQLLLWSAQSALSEPGVPSDYFCFC